MSEGLPPRTKLRQMLLWGVVALAIGVVVVVWQRLWPQGLPPGVASVDRCQEDTGIGTHSGGRVLPMVDMSIVWPQTAANGLMGTTFFVAALQCFRSNVTSKQS